MEHHSQRQNIVIPGSTQGLGQPTKKRKPRFNLLLPLTPPGKKQRSQGKAWLIYFSASGDKAACWAAKFSLYMYSDPRCPFITWHHSTEMGEVS
jgi:hypothetical protein